MRKNDKSDILYHTPLNTKFRGKPTSQGLRECGQTHPSNVCCCSVCVLPCACVCFVSLRKGESSEWKLIKTNHQSSLCLTVGLHKKTTKECNWTASRDATNKTMSHSSELQSCLKMLFTCYYRMKKAKLHFIYNLLWHFIFRSVISHLVSGLFFPAAWFRE